MSRRHLTAAGTAGLTAARGTPEQIHLTWGDDPARTVVVSWTSAGQATRPRVRIGQRVIPAAEHARSGAPGSTVSWTYHALVDGLRPGATYGYAVTADNDANAADPFSATFTTAPAGRAAFRFTSCGDFAAPDPAGPGSYGQAAYAVGAVETFQPLFHLFNTDPACAGPVQALHPAVRAQHWRDFGNDVQTSAANRPWLPVPGGLGPGPDDGEQWPVSRGSRYLLPSNGVDGFAGRWYAFRVGTALFVCLSGDDVAYTSEYARGYSGGAQTRWLEATLAAARGDPSVDWIVVQLHQCACSSGADDHGSDLGVRREWLPLFDTYEVDLVLSGHGDGYERSFPVRGVDSDAGTDAAAGAAAGTRRPHPVTTVDSAVFDTSQGTVHLVLGGKGAPPRPGAPAAGAVEAATWSARRDASAAYGIAVFDVSPGGEAGGQTSVTVRYYHALGADPVAPAADEPVPPSGDYTLFDTFTLVRPRSDSRRWHPKL